MDSKDPRHEKANQYVFDIDLRKDLFVQSATLLEPVPVRRPLSELPIPPNRDAVAPRERR